MDGHLALGDLDLLRPKAASEMSATCGAQKEHGGSSLSAEHRMRLNADRMRGTYLVVRHCE